MRRLLAAALLAAASSLVACGDGSSAQDGGSGGGGSGGDGLAGSGGRVTGNEMPALSELTAATWNRLEPGGETLCALGSTYAFFVYPGAPDKVAVDFMGGGACWAGGGLGSCREGSTTYSPTVEGNVDFDRLKTDAGGLLDMDDAANPLKGWTHVLVSYCTGDIHWGDNDHDYGTTKPFVVHHRGAKNATSALEWVYDNFRSPSKVLVAGCSAGAYGSILWSAHVQQHYPGVHVVQLADSGAGVITPEFRSMNFPSWNPAAAFPAFIPALDPAKVDVNSLELPDMYVAIGAYYPDMLLSQFNYLQDQVQQGFYLLMGGPVTEWSNTMLDHLEAIHAGTPNFSSYVADGITHCAIPFKAFYTEGVPGEQSLATWTGKLIDGQDPGDVACPDCVQTR